MRTCIGISVVIHAAVMLWLLLAPGAKTFAPANAEAILVDLVPPPETPAAEQKPLKPEDTKSEDTKPEGTKSEDTKSEPAKTQEVKPEVKPEPKPKPELARSAAQKPEPPKPQPAPAPKGNSRAAAEDSAEERAATAARLAWMLNLPTETEASLAGPPSDSKSNLASNEIAEFKAQVAKCWVVPAGVPTTPGFDVLIRIALNPDGRLGAKPELVRAPASIAGPPLVDSAKRALQKCQPYATLPADKYQDWKILELTFTAQGPAGLSGPVRQ